MAFTALESLAGKKKKKDSGSDVAATSSNISNQTPAQATSGFSELSKLASSNNGARKVSVGQYSQTPHGLLTGLVNQYADAANAAQRNGTYNFANYTNQYLQIKNYIGEVEKNNPAKSFQDIRDKLDNVYDTLNPKKTKTAAYGGTIQQDYDALPKPTDPLSPDMFKKASDFTLQTAKNKALAKQTYDYIAAGAPLSPFNERELKWYQSYGKTLANETRDASKAWDAAHPGPMGTDEAIAYAENARTQKEQEIRNNTPDFMYRADFPGEFNLDEQDELDKAYNDALAEATAPQPEKPYMATDTGSTFPAMRQIKNELDTREIGREYAPLVYNEDFAEKSKYIPSQDMQYPIAQIGTETAKSALDPETYQKLFYASINGNQTASDILHKVWAQEGLGGNELLDADANYENFMSDYEVAIYNYLYNTQGLDEATEFYNGIFPSLQKRWALDSDANLKEALKDPGMAALYSMASVVTKPVIGLTRLGHEAYDLIAGNEINPYDSFYHGTQIMDKARGYIGENIGEAIANAGGSETLQTLGKIGYQAVMSGFDSSIGLMIGSEASNILGLSGNAYNETTKYISIGLLSSDAASGALLSELENGVEPTRAVVDALTTGLVEFFTEKIGMDNLFNSMFGMNKQGWISMTKQFLAEGSEELVGNNVERALGQVYDTIAGQNYGDMNQRVSAYILEHGMALDDRDQALALVLSDEYKAKALTESAVPVSDMLLAAQQEAATSALQEDIEAFSTGALSTITGEGAFGMGRTYLNDKAIKGYINASNPVQVNSLIELGLSQDQDSQAYKKAEAANEAFNSGEVTEKQVKDLTQALLNESHSQEDPETQKQSFDNILNAIGLQTAAAQNTEENLRNGQLPTAQRADSYREAQDVMGNFMFNTAVRNFMQQGQTQREAMDTVLDMYNAGVDAAAMEVQKMDARNFVNLAIQRAVNNGADPAVAESMVKGIAMGTSAADANSMKYLSEADQQRLTEISASGILLAASGHESVQMSERAQQDRIEVEKAIAEAVSKGAEAAQARNIIESYAELGSVGEQQLSDLGLSEDTIGALAGVGERQNVAPLEDAKRNAIQEGVNRSIRQYNAAKYLEARTQTPSIRNVSSTSSEVQNLQDSYEENARFNNASETEAEVNRLTSLRHTEDTETNIPTSKVFSESLSKTSRELFDNVVSDQIKEGRTTQEAADTFRSIYTAGFTGTDIPEGYSQRLAPAVVESIFAQGARDSKSYTDTLVNKGFLKARGSYVNYHGEGGVIANVTAAKAINNGIISQRTLNTLNRFAKSLGISVNIVDSDPNFNGEYKGWKADVTLALDSGFFGKGASIDSAILGTFGHEITHRLQDISPRAYAQLVQRVTEAVGQKAIDEEIDNTQRHYVSRNMPTLSYEKALDEVVADYVGRVFFKDSNFADRFFGEAVEYENNEETKEKIRGLRDLVRKFINWIRGNKNVVENADQKITQLQKVESTLTSLLEEATEAVERSTDIVEEELEPANEDGMRQSIRSLSEAAGLDASVNNRTGEIVYTYDGKRITNVSSDHIKHSGIGAMITLAAENGNITRTEANNQYQAFADIMNMIMNTQNADLVWQFVGSEIFSAVKSNADNQYGTTVDMSTICKKTQDMITAMSAAMVSAERGLTIKEVTDLQNRINNNGMQVPCPVCYVFSRWAGIGSVLDQMRTYQEKYPVGMSTKELQDAVTRLQNEKKADTRKRLMEESAAYRDLVDTRKEEQARKKKIDADLRAAKKANNEAEIKRLLDEQSKAKKLIDEYKKMITALEQTSSEISWLTRTRISDTYKPVPYHILFDLDAGATIAKEYPDSWKYRMTRGAGKGKAILPYSDFRFGALVDGPKNGGRLLEKGRDVLKTGEFNKEQRKLIENAILRTKAQNLIGGQRYQSTSDFRYDYALDYLQSFIEAQALGSNLQTYTKVIEYAELIAAVGGDVNLSVMPLGRGYDDNGKLQYSSVTGIDYDAAKTAAHLYDSAQLILVGINDQHIKLALADPEIGFVIPWHASGASTDFTKSLLSNLGESYDAKNYKNYEPVQEDHDLKNTTNDQKRRKDLRFRLLTGAELTDSDIEYLEDLDESEDISSMSFAELRDIENQALRGNKNSEETRKAIEKYLSWSEGVLYNLYQKMTSDEYKGVKLSTGQAASVMPHEYWNTETTLDNAYVNGFIFRSYCYSLGLQPRFTGYNSNGKYQNFGDFSNEEGYWKTLIDRPMYDNAGNYRAQKAINLNQFQKEMLNPEHRNVLWGDYATNMPNTDRAKQVGAEYGESIRNSIKINDLSDAQLAEIDDTAIAALNINNDAQDFLGQILSGEKTIETRATPIVVNGRELKVGDRVGLVATGRKDRGMLKGYATIKAIHHYTAENFQQDYDKHLVAPGSKYDIKPGGTKIGYEFTDVTPLTEWIPTSNDVKYPTGTRTLTARYSLRPVNPVQPDSDRWSRGPVYSEIKAEFPGLWDTESDDSDSKNPTSVKITEKSYRKYFDFLKDEGFTGRILDASSGLGYGTEVGRNEYGFDIEDIEPYPQPGGHQPSLGRDYSTISDTFDFIISNAVLNVMPQDQRDALVVKMGEMLNPGGRMVINVRTPADISSAKSKVPIPGDTTAWYISSTGSYQKGFTFDELRAYLLDALGDGYTVERTKFGGGVTVLVQKNKGDEIGTARYSVRNDNGVTDYNAIMERNEQRNRARTLLSATAKWRSNQTRLDVRNLNKRTDALLDKYGDTLAKDQREKISNRVKKLAYDILRDNTHSVYEVEMEATRIASDIVFQTVDVSDKSGRALLANDPTVEHAVDELTNYILANILATQTFESKRLQQQVGKNERLNNTIQNQAKRMQQQIEKNERLNNTIREVRAKRDAKYAEDVQRRKEQREKKAESALRREFMARARRMEALAKKSPAAQREAIMNELQGINTNVMTLTDGKAKNLQELSRWAKERNKQDPLGFNPDQSLLETISTMDDTYINGKQEIIGRFATNKEAQAALEKYNSEHQNDTEPYNIKIGRNKAGDYVVSVFTGGLSIQEVQRINEALKNIEHEIREGNKLANTEDRRNIHEIGRDIMEGIRNSRPRAVKHTKTIEALYNEMVRPETFFRRLIGFDNSNPLYQITFGDDVSLATGQRDMIDYQRRANEKYFRKFLDDKSFIQSIIGKKSRAIEIRGMDENGNVVTLKVTPDLLMAIYMHRQNEQNLKHIADTETRKLNKQTGEWETVINKAGGMTVPNYDLYKAGKVQEAYERGTKITMSLREIQHIVSQLTNKEMSFIHAAQAYYSQMSQPEINRVSEALHGYSIATVDNYFRINTDPQYRAAQMDTIKYDGTIEGMGWTKERQNASNPIILVSLTEQLQRDIDGHSKYVGMAIPIRNFNKAYGVSENTYDSEGKIQTAYASSVMNELSRMYGSNPNKYIEKLMSDIQNPTSTQDFFGRILSKVRSHYAGAVLTINAGVAIKQSASYPTAAAEIGWAPLMKAMGNLSIIKGNRLNMDLIYKYSPLMRLRTEGMFNQEVGEMHDQGRNIPKLLNWIQLMDVATVKKLWKASEYYVRANFKNLQVGTDAYYKKVGEVHGKVIEKTQPNYSTLQRPQILRTNNELVKTLNMFKTQPFQNLNILMESIGELKAMQRAYKANHTEENRAALARARKRVSWAVSSQAISGLVFALMQFAWDWARKKDDKYRDEEGDLALDTWSKSVAINIGSNAFGMVPFGSVIFEAIETATDKITETLGGEAFFDATFYGIDAGSATDGLNDALKSIINILGDGVSLTTDLLKQEDGSEPIDWEGYARNTVNNALNLMELAGIPAENGKKDLAAIAEWIMQGAMGKNESKYWITRVLDGITSSNKKSLVKNLSLTKDDEQYEHLYNTMIEEPKFGSSKKTSQEYIDDTLQAMKAAEIAGVPDKGFSNADLYEFMYENLDSEDYQQIYNDVIGIGYSADEIDKGIKKAFGQDVTGKKDDYTNADLYNYLNDLKKTDQGAYEDIIARMKKIGFSDDNIESGLKDSYGQQLTGITEDYKSADLYDYLLNLKSSDSNAYNSALSEMKGIGFSDDEIKNGMKKSYGMNFTGLGSDDYSVAALYDSLFDLRKSNKASYDTEVKAMKNIGFSQDDINTGIQQAYGRDMTGITEDLTMSDVYSYVYDHNLSNLGPKISEMKTYGFTEDGIKGGLKSAYISGYGVTKTEDVYPFLYELYTSNSSKFATEYQKMLNVGFTEKAIKDGIEKLMKQAEGVDNVKKLSHRFAAPDHLLPSWWTYKSDDKDTGPMKEEGYASGSSWISNVSYNNGELTVYEHGIPYTYHGVSEEAYENFKAGGYRGKALNAYIKGHYSYN